MKPLISGDEHGDFDFADSSDTDSSNSGVAQHVKSLRTQTRVFCVTHRDCCHPKCDAPVQNRYEPLKDENSVEDDVVHDEDDVDSKTGMVQALSSWATKVSMKRSERKKKGAKNNDHVCETEADLDSFITDNPQFMAALPKNKKALSKLAKRCPSEEELGEDEHWMMMDSGAGCNGGKCRK